MTVQAARRQERYGNQTESGDKWHCFESIAGATLELARLLRNFTLSFVGVAELADALDSKKHFCDFHEMAFRFKTSAVLREKYDDLTKLYRVHDRGVETRPF